MNKRQVIVFTDGDQVAKKVVEDVAARIGGRCISASAGNPTPLSGPQLVDLIREAPYDPVLVMFDDCGASVKGRGEQALEYVLSHPDIHVLGAVAVASNISDVMGIAVDVVLNHEGRMVNRSVDKHGKEMPGSSMRIYGDTVDVLNRYPLPLVVGIGDVGKMRHGDDHLLGSPVSTMAVKLILDKNGYDTSALGLDDNSLQLSLGKNEGV